VRLDVSTGDGSTARFARMIARRADKVFAPVFDDDVDVVWVKFYQFTVDAIDYADLAQRANTMVRQQMKIAVSLLSFPVYCKLLCPAPR